VVVPEVRSDPDPISMNRFASRALETPWRGLSLTCGLTRELVGDSTSFYTTSTGMDSNEGDQGSDGNGSRSVSNGRCMEGETALWRNDLAQACRLIEGRNLAGNPSHPSE